MVMWVDVWVSMSTYLCFVQTSGEVIDWKKTSPTSAGADSTALKRGADSDSTPLKALS